MKKRDLKCAHCGNKVPAQNGFFRTWPDPIALHHECVNPYSKAGNKVTGQGSKGAAVVRWS